MAGKLLLFVALLGPAGVMAQGPVGALVAVAPTGQKRVLQAGRVILACPGPSPDRQVTGVLGAPGAEVFELEVDDGASGRVGQLFSSRASSCERELKVDLSGRLIVGVAQDPTGRLWVTDPESNELLELDLDVPTVARTISLPGPGTRLVLQDIDADGFFYLIESSRSVVEPSIVVLRADGTTVVRTVTVGRVTVRGLTIAPNGNLWVDVLASPKEGGLEASGLVEVTPDGTIRRRFPFSEFQFFRAAFDIDGSMWVGARTDQGDPAVRRISAEGNTIEEIEIPDGPGTFGGVQELSFAPVSLDGRIVGKLYEDGAEMQRAWAQVQLDVSGVWVAIGLSPDTEGPNLASIFGRRHLLRGPRMFSGPFGGLSASGVEGSLILESRGQFRSHRSATGSLRFVRGGVVLRRADALFVGKLRAVKNAID